MNVLSKYRNLFAIATAIAWLFAHDAPASGQSPPRNSALSRDLDGVIQPASDVEVATTETGILREVLVKPGDRVKAGQPMAILDSESLLAQIRVKEKEVASSGRIEQARGEAMLQESKYEKLKGLVANHKASQSELDRAQIDLLIAKGRLQSEIESIEVLKADLERFEQQLAERTIKAPIDGIVVEVLKEPGEVMAVNAPSLLRMIDPRRLRATFSVQENELASMPVGSTMNLQLANGTTAFGVVDYVPPVADPDTGWFMISVSIDNSDEKIIGSHCQRVP